MPLPTPKLLLARPLSRLFSLHLGYFLLTVSGRVVIFAPFVIHLLPLVIVLQMFIAVINENFAVAEESKKGQQATEYWASHQPQQTRASWIRRLNPYRWVKANPVRVKVENLPSNLVLPMQKALVQDYSLSGRERRANLV